MSETLIIGFNGPQYQPRQTPGAWCLTSDGETFQPLENGPFELEIRDEDYHGQEVPISLHGGHMDTESDDLPMVRKILREHVFRVCPWAVLWLTPAWNGCAYALGKAWLADGIALVQSGMRADTILSISLHETWHLLEHRLPADLLAELDKALAVGPKYGRSHGPWSSEKIRYLGLPCERRARAFERLAMLEVEGCTFPRYQYSTPENRASEILMAAWDGDLAREIMHLKNTRKGGGMKCQKINVNDHQRLNLLLQ